MEEIAGRELGGTVRIEGPISLALLPRPVLTAERVRVTGAGGADIALDVGALRFEVALPALLGGRIVPRALVLSEPELRVPWPLPGHFRPGTPDWGGPFAARIEQGRIVIGRLVLRGIEATVGRAEADGALSASGTVDASGIGGGIGGRVRAELRPAGADGARGLALALDGDGRANGFGGTFEGAIEPDGTVAGRIAARGPDLSLLVPAPPVPFRLEGRARATGGTVAAGALALVVGGSSARGAATVRLSPAARLDASVEAGRLDLDQWLAALARSGGTALAPAIPVHLDLAVDAADLGGGTVRQLRAGVDWADRTARLGHAEALLPGEASLRGTGRIAAEGGGEAGAGGGVRFDGRLSLSAPDGRATARWLAGLGVPGIGALPPGVGQSAELAASVSAGGGRFALTDLAGRLDGSAIGGAIQLRRAPPAELDADLRFDRLALDPWLSGPPPALAALPGMLGGRLRVAAAHAQLRGVGIDDLAFDGASDGATLVVRALGGTAGGVAVTASGSVGPGGRIAGGKLRLLADNGAALERAVPASWRGLGVLRQGPVALDAAADGPPDALAVHGALDWGDARLEAAPVIDWPGRSWRGPITLRHPGAARLLRAAGFGPGDWLGEGSLSLAGRFSGGPGVLAADGFELTAGLLRARGELALDRTGRRPLLSGRVVADSVPVPVPRWSDTEPVGFDRLRGWDAAVRVEAASVFAAGAPGRPIAEGASATVALADGMLRLDPVGFRVGGSPVSGTLGIDASPETPTVALSASLPDLDIAGKLTGWPIDIVGGRGQARAHLVAAGHSLAALAATASGSVSLALHDGALAGFSLPALRSAVAAAAGGEAGSDPARAAQAALDGGLTPFSGLDWNLAVANGVATFDNATVLSPDGTVSVAGTVPLPAPSGRVSPAAAGADLRLLFRPDPGAGAPAPPAVGLRLQGPLSAPRRTPELADLARWQAEQVPH